ncbi:hypothetical protein BCR35DRAFT_299538 [Leucosporidium creatinivorum]|uniref:Alpha/Beta hydrolase protein n=1 Tax=Leucosporidium creatinivorum TaxID=106004 RepID=A0A1Y2G1Y5_9BASI|nr:hypothetical protein BCR35DRAFT_299538 [Leucosporidium creatinivorum]
MSEATEQSQAPEAPATTKQAPVAAPQGSSSQAFTSLRSHTRTPSITLLPEAYQDPEAYLLDNRFHKSLKFRPSFVEPSAPAHRLTYAVAGSTDPEAATLLWLNGLGGNRMAACFLDGICDEHDVRIISIDRPASGGSTPVPLARRFEWTHEAVVALLAHEGITTFSILSHSNGELYTLYFLLNLQPRLTVLEWVASSPFVPPWLSGSIPLSIARWIPSQATGSLGGLLSGIMKAESWSTGTASGLLAFSGGLSSGLANVSTGLAQGWAKGGGIEPEKEEEQAEEQALKRGDSQEKKFIQFALRQAEKEPHKKAFGGRYYPPELFSIGLSWVLAEGLDAWGEEALVCLRKGDGARWGWGEGPEGEPVDEQLLFERGFGDLKIKLEEEARPTKMSVWFGEEDGLIPPKGRAYLRDLLVERLKLVTEDDWHTIPDTGHDQTLSLDCMLVPLLRRVKASTSAHEEAKRARA